TKLEAVAGLVGDGTVGEARFEEGAEEPVAAPVAGEDAAGAIPPMSGRRQPHHEHARSRIAESGERPGPVGLAAVPLRRVAGRGLAMAHEPGAEPAAHDSSGEGAELRAML